MNNNNKENPLITLLIFVSFFGSIGLGFCGIALWNNPLIMFCGFMGSIGVLAVGGAVYFWHQDQVVSGIKEYRANLPYIAPSVAILAFLAVLVVGFQDSGLLSVIGALGVVLSGFFAMFFRNLLLIVFVKKSVKRDIHAKQTEATVKSVHEHCGYYSDGSSKTIYKLILDIDGIKSYCFFKQYDNHNRVPSEGSTINVLFNHSKPKYSVIVE